MKSFKYLKYFEDFKQNNITVEDIIKCIDNNGTIETDIVKNYKDKIKAPIRPVEVDNDGEISVDIDSQIYLVDLEDVKKINY